MHGTEARIRVSSVMRPASSCGTLRSARMKTRLPATLAGGDEVGEAKDVHAGAKRSRILRLRPSSDPLSPRFAARHVSRAVRAHSSRPRPETAPCRHARFRRLARRLPAPSSPPPAAAAALRVRASQPPSGVAADRRLARAALQVQGAEQPVRLASLQVDVEVAGGAAETRVQMVFFNPNNRILEGKLQFPLAPGQVVSGFALDVDGQLRAAVPVEKARAQQVFEDIARRRVDPGLLQTTIGNNYELRIYPLLPGKTRTVELRIVEPAAGRLQIPLGYADRVESLALSLRVPGARERARAGRRRLPLGLRFEREPRRRLRRAHDRATTRRCRRSRSRCACRPRGQAPAIATEERDGQSYFTLELPVRSAARRGRCRIASRSSGTLRARARSAARPRAGAPRRLFLGACATPASAWSASPTSPRRRCASRFAAATGAALRRALEATVYDGASNLGAVRHDGVSARGALVQRRPGELRRAVAARVSGAGLRDQQRGEQRPGGAAGARRRHRRPQHRPRDGDAPGRRRRAAAARQRGRGVERARRARRSSSSRRARRRAGSSSPAS